MKHVIICFLFVVSCEDSKKKKFNFSKCINCIDMMMSAILHNRGRRKSMNEIWLSKLLLWLIQLFLCIVENTSAPVFLMITFISWYLLTFLRCIEKSLERGESLIRLSNTAVFIRLSNATWTVKAGLWYFKMASKIPCITYIWTCLTWPWWNGFWLKPISAYTRASHLKICFLF